ncbi:MAG TPA: protein kinase, partial [Polyangium sp.]|nr:protein kinase [Polyangium sp.]
MHNEFLGRARVGSRFVLERRAGSGGMGDVFKATDEQSGLSVAVKIMREGSEEDSTRFLREARILSELEHPRIVRHIAHGVMDEGAPWLAMEWLDGEDLSARLVHGRLGTGETLQMALDVAEGLALAHSRGFVHRDLKPSNLFLVGGKLDDVRILDFGIALARVSTRMTRTGMLVGTPGYMAPEQARGDQVLDARADIYSLGSVLFECITGEPVFFGVHVAALLAKVLFEDAPRLRDKLSGVSATLDDLLARMLSKEPSDRPENGQELATILRSLGKMADVERLHSPPPLDLLRSLTTSEKRAVAVIFIAASDSTGDKNIATGQTRRVTEDPHIRAEAERFGGRCESLLDGSIAVLLTSTSLATDLAARAARCALSLKNLVPGRTIALANGRADSTDKSPLGQVIDRAATLCGADKPKTQQTGVLLDEVVAGLLDARFDVREESAGLVLYDERELGEGTRTLLGKATPCVGRERDLRLIEESFEECLEGNAQAMLVIAPAGVGKSRLGHEFLRTVRDRHEDVAIWIARGDSLRAGSALGMLGQAVRGACGILEGETIELRRDKVRKSVIERIDESNRKRVTEFLGEIIGTSFPDDDSVPLRAARVDGMLMTEQMRSAFLDFLGAECAKRPVLILLEDLHWGDRPTIQFLDAALRQLSEQPVFVLALSRPEVREVFPDLWSNRKVVEIRLKELGRKPIERLVRHALGNDVPAETIERFVRLSEGNAFYLEELIRFAAEGRGGQLPETVVAMVQSRLGTLDDVSRRVLRAASVFGEVSWSGGVATLLGDGQRQTAALEQLTKLVELEVLVKRKESRFPQEEEFAFRHALLREGAYGLLTEEDRVLGHKLAGEWLEARGEEDALWLADHFEKGAEKGKAAEYYLRAAKRAYLAGDSINAIANAKRGLPCAVLPEQRMLLLGILCLAQFWFFDLGGSVFEYASELVANAPKGSLPWGQGMMVLLMTAAMSGDGDALAVNSQEVMTVAPSTDFDETTILLMNLSVVAMTLDQMGRVREGDVFAERMKSIGRAFEEMHPSMKLYEPRAMPAMRDIFSKEHPASALRWCEESGAVAESNGNRRYQDMSLILMVGTNRWLLGDMQEADSVLSSAVLPDEAFAFVSSWRLFTRAWIHADLGGFDKAHAFAAELVQSGKTRKNLVDEARGHWVLGEVLRRMGDFAAANTELETAKNTLQVVCPVDFPGVLASWAKLRHAEGRHGEALALAEEGLSLYAKM